MLEIFLWMILICYYLIMISISSSNSSLMSYHKSAVFNQFQQHQQSLLAPVNTNFASKNVEHPLLQASLVMSPRNMEPISPMGSRISMLAQREKQQFRSLSFRELGSNSAASAASTTSANS